MSLTLNQTDHLVGAARTGGFDHSQFSMLEQLEERSFWFQSRNKLIVWAVGKFLPSCRNFIEIGCGNAFVLSGLAAAFPHIELSGTDLFEEALPCARSRLPQANFFQLDVMQLSDQAKYDAVGCFDVLEHIFDDREALARMSNAIVDNGHLLISVPQYKFLWSRSDDVVHHVRRYTYWDLRDKCKAAGLDVVFSTSFVTLLFPALILSRLWQNIVRSEYDVYKELSMPPLLNAFFAMIQTIERALIELGLKLPFGGSLLLVLRKTANPGSANTAQPGQTKQLLQAHDLHQGND